MKREFTLSTFIAIIAVYFLASCSSDSGNGTEEGGADTLSLEQPDTISLLLEDSTSVVDTIALEIPSFEELMAKQDENLTQLFNNYKLILSTPDNITDEAELKRVFSMRDSLMSLIQYDVLEDHFASIESDYEKQEVLIKELEKLGMQSIFAEGMYGGLAEGTILLDKIKEVGSEPFQLYLDFKQQYGNSLGSEYTYQDLEPEMEMVKIGEQLTSKHPESEYIELIKENYEGAILALTDVHAVISEDSTVTDWIIGGVQVSAYPNSTGKDNYEKFVADYAETQLSKVTEKILKNASALPNIDNEQTDTLYLLTAEWVSTWTQARESALAKIKSGFAAPHCLPVKTAEGEKYAVVYRFYPTMLQAEENLPWAKEEVSIVKVTRSLRNGLEQVVEIE